MLDKVDTWLGTGKWGHSWYSTVEDVAMPPSDMPSCKAKLNQPILLDQRVTIPVASADTSWIACEVKGCAMLR